MPSAPNPDPSAESLRHVVIVGLMGSGKTTIGSGLARRLGWPFHDSDAEIESKRGQNVHDLAESIGVEAMHRLEAQHLLDALAHRPPTVIAAAASVVDDPACREALVGPNVSVVWLRANPGVLARRFGSAAHRPVFGPDPRSFLAEEAARRNPLFASLRPLAIDTGAQSAKQAIDRIVGALTSR